MPVRCQVNSSKASIQVRDAWVSYGSDAELGAVLRGVTMNVRAGELCVVIGPNGSGKSTLLKAMAGLLPLSRGQITLFGDDLARLERREIARHIAVVPQAPQVALGFSVREVVMMGRAPHQGTWLRTSPSDDEVVARVLEVCELGALSGRPVAELSGGEQRRVALARALAQEAPVLLLDEPGAHLDIRATVAIHEQIRQEIEQRKIACLAVIHDLNMASMVADRVVLLREGLVLDDGPTEEMMTEERLRDALGAELSGGRDPRTGQRYFLPIRPNA